MTGKGTIVYGNISRLFKKTDSDKVLEMTAKDFIWNQVNLRETSGKPYSLCLTSCLPPTQEQWRKPSALSLVWKRRKAEAEAPAFLKRARTGCNRDMSACQEWETKVFPLETTNPCRKKETAERRRRH